MHSQSLLKDKLTYSNLGMNYLINHKDNKETTMDESLKLYADVRNISSKSVSLVTVKNHAKYTLNLAVAIKNGVAEMRLNLEDIPVPNMMHLHK